jgi:hypothetical protein
LKQRNNNPPSVVKVIPQEKDLRGIPYLHPPKVIIQNKNKNYT